MQREIISIDGLKYLCELYEGGKETFEEDIYKEYVIIRNIDLYNTVAYDTDILFIDKSIFNELKENKTEICDNVVWPIAKNGVTQFSRLSTDYNSLLNADNMKYTFEGGIINQLLEQGEESMEVKKVLCNKLKIYHPFSKADLSYIIYIDNFINGIHFHYLCNTNKYFEEKYGVRSENEKVIDNEVYSEYIEIYFPNINFLFNQLHQTNVEKLLADTGEHKNMLLYYWNLSSNFDDFYDRLIDWGELPDNIFDKIVYNWNSLTLSEKQIYYDYNVYIEDIYNVNKYVDILSPSSEQPEIRKNKNSSWISMKKTNDGETLGVIPYDLELTKLPLGLMLNPFITQSTEDGIEEKIFYKMNNTQYSNYTSFPINVTLYPYEYSQETNLYLLNSNYNYTTQTFISDYKFRIISKIGFDGDHSISLLNTFDYPDKSLSVQEAYAQYNNLTIIKDETGMWKCLEYENWHYDENDEDFEIDSPINCCGFQLDISIDYNFNTIIYTDYRELNFISNFSFSLYNIFNKWENIPNTLIARVSYIDKYLGLSITSNFIVLTKEYIKYIISKDINNTPRLSVDFIEKQNTELPMGNWKTVDAENVKFNFINNINCIVQTNTTDNRQILKKSNNNSVKILYKPIFYRTQPLQSLRLVSGFNQKIGIDLANYMTKVSTFKLIIDGNVITEYGRNDIYVIFNINTNTFNNLSGKYHIVNQDDDYIESGVYEIN